MGNSVTEDFKNIAVGIKLYRNLHLKNKITIFDKCFTYIMPDYDEDALSVFFENIDRFLKDSRFKKVLFISTCEIKIPDNYQNKKIRFSVITHKEMNNIIYSFDYCKYDQHGIILSLSKPNMRYSERLLSCSRITRKDIYNTCFFVSRRNSELHGSLKIHYSNRIRYYLACFAYSLIYITGAYSYIYLYYLYRIKGGYEVYNRLKKEYSNGTLYLAPYKGTGDVYLAAAMLQNYIKANNLKDGIIGVIGGGNRKIAGMFGFESFDIKRRQMDNLMCYIKYANINQSEIFLLHHDPPHIDSGILDLMRNINDLNFYEIYQYALFEDINNDYFQLPKFECDKFKIDSLFTQNGLIPGKTVLIAPYSYTLPNISKKMWAQVVNELNNKGYTVCTNVASKKEKAIKGTIPLFIPYKQLVPFLDEAGYFIGIRSGICEILASSTCKKIVLYKKGFDWNGKDSLDYFSLSKMGLCDAVEMEYYKKPFDKLAKSIINEF